MNKKYNINEKLTKNSSVGGFTIIQDNNDHAKRPLGNWSSDNAWDLKAPIGTPVYSYTNGTVRKIHESGNKNPKIFGTQVSITGEDGYPNIFYTHLDSVTLTKGTKVKVGDFIGKITRWPASPEASHVHIGLQTGDLGDVISRNPNVNNKFNPIKHTELNPTKHTELNPSKHTQQITTKKNTYNKPKDEYGGSDMFQDMISTGLNLKNLSKQLSSSTPLNEYANGQIPSSDLISVNLPTGGVGPAKLNKEAANDFNNMVKAAYDESKIQLKLVGPNSGYRRLGSKEEGCSKDFTQWCAWIRFKSGTGNLAANPGNSNHGEGAAVDIDNCKRGGTIHTWLTKNAKRFNFYPLASEPWHWDHASGKGKKYVPSPVINTTGPRVDDKVEPQVTGSTHNTDYNTDYNYSEPEDTYGGSEMFQDMISSGLGLKKLSSQLSQVVKEGEFSGLITFNNPCPQGEISEEMFSSKNKLKIKTTKGLDVIAPYDGVIIEANSSHVVIQHNVRGEKWTSEIDNFINYTGVNQRVLSGRQIGVSENGSLTFKVRPSVDVLKLITVGIMPQTNFFKSSSNNDDESYGGKKQKNLDTTNDAFSDIMKAFLAPVDFVKHSLIPENKLISEEIKKIKRLL